MNETAELGASSSKRGPGRMLAQLRAERKLSIADVAQRLKYGARQIEALEAEEFDRLPGATFVRGMVRGYAKLLDTDPQPLLDELDQRYVPGEIDLDLRDKGIPFVHGKRGTRAYLALSVLALIVVAGILYEWRAGTLPWPRFASDAPPPQKESKALPAEQPAAPRAETQVPAAAAAPSGTVAETPAAPAQQPTGGGGGEGRIRLEFDRDSWVEIRDRDGKTLMSQLNPAGSRRVVVGQRPLSLVIGSGAAVRLTYNDKPVDLKPYIQIEVARLTLN
ncbi:MAG: helix-turn-helix domain-containing protein [Betaproteobacteria bacterium]|jgi:cytoskeleton protein RodZ|nr:MAG: helix-turn-helix domain-containing protein [Betaproteobacteria bacterium]TMH77563.1 MAG: helix-turn-helix domain-containing protein [Betaproteobacteria bacterium]